MDFINQSMPPFYIGEDRPYTIRGVASSSNPTTWAVRLTITPLTGTAFSVSLASGVSRAVTGTGPWPCTFTVQLPHASTKLCGAGLGTFQFDRTDVGFETILAAGTITISTPTVSLP